MKNNAIILIHPQMSSQCLIREIKRRELNVISLIRTYEVAHLDIEFVLRHSDLYYQAEPDEQLAINELNSLIEANGFNVIGVINGIDSGRYQADALIKKHVDPSVELDYSLIRLNKFKVNEALKCSNIASIRGEQVLLSDPLETKLNAADHIGFPCVIKPSQDTAAMADVKIVHSPQELLQYFRERQGKENAYFQNSINDKFLIQQYIPHERFREFALDFVTVNGTHTCVGIIEYVFEKVDDKYSIRRKNQPLDLEAYPELSVLIDYTVECLDALHVRQGHTHNEVFWDGAQEVLLVESNNRVAGSGNVELYALYYGISPYAFYLDSMQAKMPEHRFPVAHASEPHCLLLDLYNYTVDNPTSVNLQGLQSEVTLMHFRNKTKISPQFYIAYNRLESIACRVMIRASSALELEADIETLLARERDGSLFLVS